MQLLGTSLAAIFLFALHFADDIARGIEDGDLFDYTGVLIIAVWLYATLTMAHRRLGLGIMLLFSLGAAAVPALHMSGAGLTGGRIAGSSGVLLWVFTMIALGVTGLVSSAIIVQRLWELRRNDSRHA